MIKLVIQIPCFNEEQALVATLAELPREVPGIDRVEWLIVDDGSTDRTVEVAREHGVDHVVSLRNNQGLARAFMAGLSAALDLGADIIVNTDADNQYCAADIPKLVEPILAGRADLVIGERPIHDMEQYSALKRLLHRVGTRVVKLASHTQVADAPSGFRALSREAAMQMNVFTDYTYTLETLIQAGQKGMSVCSVPVRTNAMLRPSRLMRSVPSYVRRSFSTILRIVMTYKPLTFFAVPAGLAFGAGFLLGLRFLWFFLSGEGQGHVQSVILSALLLGAGFLLFVVGLLADLISVNRKLLEKLDWRLRSMEEQRTAERAGQRPADE